MDLGMKLNPTFVLGKEGLRADSKKGEPVQKTAEQFESFLITSILREFDRASGLAKKGYAEQMQMSIFYEKMGDALAKKGIGIKEMLAKYAESGAKVSKPNGEKSS